VNNGLDREGVEQVSPIVTVCICHYNRINKLKHTINSLRENTTEDYRLKIFNDGYINDEIHEYLSNIEQEPHISVTYSEKNVGPVAGRNRLLTNIDTPFVMTLDDDMYVDEDWLSNALDIFNSDKNVGFVGFKFTSTTDESIVDTRSISINDGVISLEHVDLSIEQNNSKRSSYLLVDEVPTGAMIFREEALKDFRFDPNYKIGFGDIDKTLQIRCSNWEQAICLKNNFIHDKKTNSEEYSKGGRYSDIFHSYQYFTQKWGVRYPMREHIKFKYIYKYYGLLCNLFNIL
jgi:GT2 family glycosyltransferase